MRINCEGIDFYMQDNSTSGHPCVTEATKFFRKRAGFQHEKISYSATCDRHQPLWTSGDILDPIDKDLFIVNLVHNS
jgi:hypothetical protein